MSIRIDFEKKNLIQTSRSTSRILGYKLIQTRSTSRILGYGPILWHVWFLSLKVFSPKGGSKLLSRFEH